MRIFNCDATVIVKKKIIDEGIRNRKLDEDRVNDEKY